jgi:hypothetical protein
MNQVKIYDLVASASKKLAPTKLEMQALLETWQDHLIHDRAPPEYLQKWDETLALLATSADLSAFLHRLKKANL